MFLLFELIILQIVSVLKFQMCLFYFLTHPTSSGILGCITEPLYNLLKQMETNLSNTIASVGHIPHALWRSFHNERQTEASSGFIDGDHIETFLDLPRSDMKKICSNLMVSLLCRLQNNMLFGRKFSMMASNYIWHS